jgi:CheY-like chemotaxis protein
MRVEFGRPLRRLPPYRRLALHVQLLLLLAGIVVLLMAPAPGGWLLVLLLASTLNLAVAAFGHRQREAAGVRDSAGAAFLAPARPATWSPGEEGEPPPAGDEPLRRRLQSLEDDLARGEQRLDRVRAGRERAREESRLKSDYLTLLARELKPLLARLDALSLEEGEGRESGEYRRSLGELRERLGDLAALLDDISGEEPRAAAALPARQPTRVLIVDDGPVNLMLARQVLERQGLDVRTATSGAEALACLEQVPFDLVLMDIFMPGMDGMETSRRWRDVEAARHPGHHSVLVALTANASAEDRQRFEAAGLDDYLAKPYRPQALIERVRRWLPPHVDGPELP